MGILILSLSISYYYFVEKPFQDRLQTENKEREIKEQKEKALKDQEEKASLIEQENRNKDYERDEAQRRAERDRFWRERNIETKKDDIEKQAERQRENVGRQKVNAKRNLITCLQGVDDAYHERWQRHCRKYNLNDDCLLSKETSELYSMDKQRSFDECHRLYDVLKE